MAIALIIRVCDLLTEFFADAFVFLGTFQTAGAVTAGSLETFPNGLDDFLIFVKTNSHEITSFFFYYTTGVKMPVIDRKGT